MKTSMRVHFGIFAALLALLTLSATSVMAQDQDFENIQLRKQIADTSRQALEGLAPIVKSLEGAEKGEQHALFDEIVGLLNRGLAVEKMTGAEFSKFAHEVNLLKAAMDFSDGGDLLSKQENPTDGPACTRGCRLNGQECYAVNVPADAPTWPCFDCVGCNLEYLACLASCIV